MALNGTATKCINLKA